MELQTFPKYACVQTSPPAGDASESLIQQRRLNWTVFVKENLIIKKGVLSQAI